MNIAKRMRQILVLLLIEALVLSPVYAADQLSLPSSDLVAPEVIHTPDTTPVEAGASKTIRATVTDNVGIQSVILFYRTKGESDYNRRSMSKIEDSNDYTATVDNVTPPGIEYYIQVMDTAGNTLLTGYEFSPLTIAVKELADDSTAGTPAGGIAVTDTDSAVTTPTASDTASETANTEKEEGGINWLYVGLGILAVGALASGGGSGGGDDGGGQPPAGPTPPPSSVIITTPTP